MMPLLLAAAAALLFIYAHKHPARSVGPVDAYTAWLVRQQGPALHR